MEILHTTEYDESLLSGLSHLRNYPQMLPFIGRFWNDSEIKILIIGESHYIPGSELLEIKYKSHTTDWYNNNSESFYPGLKDYINTRRVVDIADKVNEKGFKKPLTMYYNIKKEIQANVPSLKNEKHIFPFFTYYNYFQRPAFIETESIINNKIDDEVAYNTLKYITRLINPKKIIFASTKAKKSFDRRFFTDEEKVGFENIIIDSIPHASSAWWNKVSPAYGNQTGRQKFISLINK